MIKKQKGYLGNPNLKKPDESVEMSQEQIDEYARCLVDPIYFIQNYVKIISLDHGLIPFKLYDYQIKFINALHKDRRILGLFPRQHGKCVHPDTKYTIRNKKTGEIKILTAEEFHGLLKEDANGCDVS
jgi:hypothetical protein